jgi:hypothetical protein
MVEMWDKRGKTARRDTTPESFINIFHAHIFYFWSCISQMNFKHLLLFCVGDFLYDLIVKGSDGANQELSEGVGSLGAFTVDQEHLASCE